VTTAHTPPRYPIAASDQCPLTAWHCVHCYANTHRDQRPVPTDGMALWQLQVLDGDASDVERVVRRSGADGATVVCYLHPGYDTRSSPPHWRVCALCAAFMLSPHQRVCTTTTVGSLTTSPSVGTPPRRPTRPWDPCRYDGRHPPWDPGPPPHPMGPHLLTPWDPTSSPHGTPPPHPMGPHLLTPWDRCRYDGRQPGGCPSMYFRDETATLHHVATHTMWVALEAGSGVVPSAGLERISSNAYPSWSGELAWRRCTRWSVRTTVCRCVRSHCGAGTAA
jgi:hypothetical protein